MCSLHFLVDQQFGYVRLAVALLDLAGDQCWVFWGGHYSVCFTCTFESVTAMPRALHDRLCLAFL